MMSIIGNPASDTNGDDLDGLTQSLASLSVDPPAGFTDRIFASWVRVAGPVSPLFVAFTDQGICYVRIAEAVADEPGRFVDELTDRMGRPVRPADQPPAGLLSALRTGRSHGLRFDLRGLTDFERLVLNKTLEIPRGETRPYGWVAREIGRPGAVRAAGTALGRNPVPILIPCHRVVRSDGEPGNYAFGPEVKERLLTAEEVDLHEQHRLAVSGVHFLASDTTGMVCYPTCHNARRITPSHRVGFRSLTEAMDAGYRPCRHCRPASVAASA
jgi:methylated-DNA-[protein]-cysteine S-methyltransferase